MTELRIEAEKKEWAQPVVEQLDVVETLGGVLPSFSEAASFTGPLGTVFGSVPVGP